MQVGVIGGGYVGLTTAACLATHGNRVAIFESDPVRSAALARGEVSFREPGLDERVRAGLASGALRVADHAADAVHGTEAVFVAVGTPPRSDGSTDESQLLAAARSIGESVDGPIIIVLKSTAPVGAAERMLAVARAAVAARDEQHRIDIVVNPEFLRAGHAVQDFDAPDRVVVGGDEPAAVQRIVALYARFVVRERILTMGAASASLVKYAANAMLATRISFMNEMANLAEVLGADVDEVRRGVGSDPRIGADYLQPGMGYGGSCLPKDVASLVAVATDAGVELGVVRAVAAANDRQVHRITEKLRARLGDLDGKRVAVWGLAFKGGTDDLRGAPSRVLIDDLAAAGADIVAHDPVAGAAARAAYAATPRVKIVDTAADAIEHADALAIAADWPEYRSFDPARLVAALGARLVVDGRNLFDPARMRSAGIDYLGIGRGENLRAR